MSKYEFKGARGEWRVRGREVGVKERSDTQSHGMLNIICTVDQFDFAEHWQANAQAISAVPELIEALRDVTANLEMARFNYSGEVSAMMYESIQQAHAALAKATGATT